MLRDEQIERYSRQIILPQVGGRGQLALLAATATVCGGTELATTAAVYLAGAGVGHLRVAPRAAAAIEGLNPDCDVTVLEPESITEGVAGAAVVVCAGSDASMNARLYAAGVAAGVPLLVGDVGGAIGAIGWMAICAGPDAPCHACVARRHEAVRGSEKALEHVTAGFIGTLLAAEAIKIILNLPRSPAGSCATFDALQSTVQVEIVSRDPECSICGALS